MKIAQAYAKGKINRFEMMALAEAISSLNLQGFQIPSLDCVEVTRRGNVNVLEAVKVKKKDILQRFSILMQAIFELTQDKRLTSIFLNHYLACQNNTAFYKYLPRSRRRPFVIACGGLSGSGKSRVARETAPFLNAPYGAIVIRDDIVRKQLAGVDFDVTLGKEWYTAEKERQVYREMRRQAKNAILAGFPVILDALFYNPKERENIKEFATRLGVPFEAFWMEAPLQMRALRVRRRKNNPSDIKNESELAAQLEQDVGQVNWHYIYTSGTPEETLDKVRSFLKKYF